MSNHRSHPSASLQSVIPTAIEAEGGVMPGASQSINAGAYPAADATRPATLPPAIAGSMGDPTGNKSRGQLLAVAHDVGLQAIATVTDEVDTLDGVEVAVSTTRIAEVDTLNRSELAEVLTATISPADLDRALRN